MAEKKNLPYGTWPSKITPELTGGLREFSELNWSGDGRLLWVERHSKNSSLMAWDTQSGMINKLSGDINVGGGIMYGGGSYDVCRDQVIFIEKETQQLYWTHGKNSELHSIGSSKQYKASPDRLKRTDQGSTFWHKPDLCRIRWVSRFPHDHELLKKPALQYPEHQLRFL